MTLKDDELTLDEVSGIIEEIFLLTRMTQRELAKKVGISQGTISKWRNKQQTPRKRDWDKLMRFCARTPQLRKVASIDAVLAETGDEEIIAGGRSLIFNYVENLPKGGRR